LIFSDREKAFRDLPESLGTPAEPVAAAIALSAQQKTSPRPQKSFARAKESMPRPKDFLAEGSGLLENQMEKNGDSVLTAGWGGVIFRAHFAG
jgi:hypothetical protein